MWSWRVTLTHPFLTLFKIRGFRRVSHYQIEEGAVCYQNALFRKKEPHLVKHMRMDSDVQDVFERHQTSTDVMFSGGKKRKSVADRKTAAKKSSLQSESEDVDRNEPPVSPTATASSPLRTGPLSKEGLLREILQLTEQFLNTPGTLSTNDTAFHSMLQVLYTQGLQHYQGRVVGQHSNPSAIGFVGNPPWAAAGLGHLQPPPSLGREMLSRPIPPGYPAANPLLNTILRNREHQQQQMQQPMRRPDHSSGFVFPQQLADSSLRHLPGSIVDPSQTLDAPQQQDGTESSRSRREYATADDLMRRVMQRRSR